MTKYLTLFFVLIVMNLNSKGQSDTYKVYALKFLYAGKGPAIGSVVGASVNDSVDVCYMIWFLKGNNGRNILVDAGYLDSTRKDFIRPDLVLKDININTSDITDIIITHPHFDHIGGLSLFPNGKVWMQKIDFDYFINDMWKDSSLSSGFNKNDVRCLIEAALNGRLNLVDGDNIEIIPGIKAYTGSTHTKENQYLMVNSEYGKNVLLASDAIWFYLNLWQLKPIEKYLLDPESYVNAMKRMKTLVKDENLIIPGHDNLVFSKYEKVNDRVVIIK